MPRVVLGFACVNDDEWRSKLERISVKSVGSLFPVTVQMCVSYNIKPRVYEPHTVDKF